MASQKTTPNRSQTDTTTRCIDVTGLTPNKRHELFTECMRQIGFKAFVQNTKNNRTHYVFQYQTEK